MRTKLFLVVALLVAGCTTETVKTVVAPVGKKAEQREAAAAAVTSKTDEVSNKQAQRDSKVAASLEAISSVTENPATLKEEAAQRESTLAKNTFAVVPSAEDKAAAMERVNLVLQGQKEAAETAYKRADAEARRLLADLAAKQRELDDAKAAEIQARAEAASERAASTQKVRDALAAKDAEIARIRDEERSKRQALMVRGLYLTGVGLGVLGVLFIALSKGLKTTEGVLLLGGGSLFVGAAVAFNHWLFPYVFWGAVAAAVIGGILYLRGNHKVQQALQHVVTKVDEKIDERSEIGRELRADLSKQMDSAHKAVIRIAKLAKK